jgi:hypothetical protein
MGKREESRRRQRDSLRRTRGAARSRSGQVQEGAWEEQGQGQVVWEVRDEERAGE